MKRQKEVEWRVKTLSPTENMKILVLDTETTSLDKPFCYDFGGIIYDTETGEILEEKSWIIEQVWYNLPLFESAYYKEKTALVCRKIAVTVCRAHQVWLCNVKTSPPNPQTRSNRRICLQ